jgi:hypothetical protein
MISKSAFRGLCITERVRVFANFAGFSNLAPAENGGRDQVEFAERWRETRHRALRLAASLDR